MDMLCFKGTYPSGIFPRIKVLLAQGLKAHEGQLDLVNALEDASHLLPLSIGHPCQAALPIDPRVEDQRPLSQVCPQSTARSTNGSHDRGDPLISQVGGNKTAWFVEQARGHFEHIRSALPAHHVIHSGIVIMSQGKKLNNHSDQAILVS